MLKVLDAERVHTRLHKSALSRIGVSKAIAESLMTFEMKSDLNTIESLFTDAFDDPALSQAFLDIKKMLASLSDFGVDNARVFVCPLLSYNRSYYGGGMMFQIGKIGVQRVEVFAAGGRYDNLLARLSSKTLSRPIGGVGFNLAIQKVASIVLDDDPGISDAFFSRRVNVLVASIGRNIDTSALLQVCRECREAGISSKYIAFLFLVSHTWI